MLTLRKASTFLVVVKGLQLESIVTKHKLGLYPDYTLIETLTYPNRNI